MTLVLSLGLVRHDGNYVKRRFCSQDKRWGKGNASPMEWCNSQSGAATTKATNQNVGISQVIQVIGTT